MSKLKLCPFCGKKPFYIEWVACVNPHCQMVNTYFVYETWNTRPIEDKLQARLDAQAAEIERLKGTLAHILAKCSDYDGYETVDGLKELVDAVVLIVANQETLTPNEPKLRDNIQLMAVRKLNKKIIHSSATKSAEIERLKAEIENLNESLMIAHMAGAYEGRESKESEVEQLMADHKDMALLIRRLAASIPLGKCDIRLKAYDYLKRKGFKSEIYRGTAEQALKGGE